MFEPGPNDTLSQNFIVLVDKMAEIFEKNEKNDEKTQFQNYPKNTLESVKMKNSKIGLRHVLSGPKLCLE